MPDDECRMAWIRPPTRDMEDGESLDVGCSSPFLCHSTSGSLPAGIPRIELRELEPYLFGPLCGGKLPLIYHKSQASEDWLETNESEDEVRYALDQCRSHGHPFWMTSGCTDITHPTWWPASEPTGAVGSAVPSYNTLILGSGNSGIGMHRDGHDKRFVSTYLSLGTGRKHVLLLPPTDEGAQLARKLVREGGVGSVGEKDVPFSPQQPTREALEAVARCRGYWFDIEAKEPGEVLTLFIPGGWWHWLIGASPWHVAWGGSFYAPNEAAGAWTPD